MQPEYDKQKSCHGKSRSNLRYAPYVDGVSTINTKTMHSGRMLRPPEMLPETEINWCEPLLSPKPQQRAAVGFCTNNVLIQTSGQD